MTVDYVQHGHFRVYAGMSGYGVRDERTGEFVQDSLESFEHAERLAKAHAASKSVAIGQEYEFVSEILQEYDPEEERLRMRTGQKALVLALVETDPECSPLYRVRFPDGYEAEVYEEELSGWDKALGQFYGPSGVFGDPK